MEESIGDVRAIMLQWSIATHPLEAGMVKVISPTIQEFEGLRYYLCGKYFQRNGSRLHVRVWERFNRKRVPSGFAVHHDGHDRANNQPTNLVLLPRSEHTSHHQLGHGRGIPEAATEAAKEWHSSEAGKRWHREHYSQYSTRLHKLGDFSCIQCGNDFRTQVTGQNKFCSNNCKSQHRRESGADNEKRVCMACGKDFMVGKYSKKSCCNRQCA